MGPGFGFSGVGFSGARAQVLSLSPCLGRGGAGLKTRESD